MSELTRVSQAQLNSVLTRTGERSRRRLSSEDGTRLTEILEKAQRRWPNQDTAESMEEYLADFEQLALKYSLLKLSDAFDALRIAPDQAFFPKPDEVAEWIERKREAGLYADNTRRNQMERERDAALMAEEQRKYGNWRERWLASGLTLAEFFKTDERVVAADRERA